MGAIAALAVLTGLALAAPAQAAFPGQNGKIAFVAGGHIWTMNLDGTARTQLTSGPAETGILLGRRTERRSSSSATSRTHTFALST